MKSRCRICRTVYEKWSMTQKTCPKVECAIALVQKDKEKKARKELRERREAIRSRAEWLKLAQAEFNKFIRKRDEHLPCISCGRNHQGQWHAGHYLSTGAHPELRFNENNCHRQCQPCNTHLSGNVLNYRHALKEKIGTDELLKLEGPHDPKKWTIDELKEIITLYRKKTKELS